MYSYSSVNIHITYNAKNGVKENYILYIYMDRPSSI